MIPLEILIISIVLSTLTLLERALRHKHKFKKLYTNVSQKKSQIEASYKDASSSTDSDIVNVVDDLIDISETINFLIPN